MWTVHLSNARGDWRIHFPADFGYSAGDMRVGPGNGPTIGLSTHMSTTSESLPITDSAATVVAHVRALINRGTLGPGARLPAERQLARQVGVSRPTVRAGLRTLAALGVVRSRRGSGTYIPDGPPTLGVEALTFVAALHNFSGDDFSEARRILEVAAAGLAAERATPDQLATLADEVAGLFASMTERQVFLVHDISFHRSLAAASERGARRVEYLGGAEQFKRDLADRFEPLHQGFGLARGVAGHAYVTRVQLAIALRKRLKRSERLHRLYLSGALNPRRNAPSS